MSALPNRPRLVGEPLQRPDSFARVAGTQIYGFDFSLPGALHGKVFRSSHPHARIVSLDVSRAAALPGVVRILTANDVPPVRFGVTVKDSTVLAADKVLYIGQPIALVAALSPEIAEQATRLIEVVYESLDAVFDVETAILPDAPELHPDWREFAHGPVFKPLGGNVANRATMRFGDVDSAFASAWRTYEHRFTTSMVHAGYTEPRAATAVWEDEQSVTVWSNVQTPYEVQNTLAEILQLSASQVRVIVPGVGGGFGGKLRIGVDHFAALLARATRRPVKLVTTTEEELTAAHPRQSAVITLRTAIDAQGLILARRGRVILDCGAGAGTGPGTSAAAQRLLLGPYRTPAFDMEGFAVYTNKVPSGSFRAPAGPMANFAVESQMDIIARDLGADPLEFRLRNVVKEGDIGPSGDRLTSVTIEECLLKAAEAIGWNELTPDQKRGKGIACGCWTIATSGPSTVVVKIGIDGKVQLNSGAVEMGTGALPGAAQILAEELAIDPDDVRLAPVDTHYSPYDLGSLGSRTVFFVGNACRDAAAKLREELFVLAEAALKRPRAEMRLHDKRVFAGEDSITIAELVRRSGLGVLASTGKAVAAAPEFDRARFEHCPIPVWIGASYYAHAVDLCVEESTGEVTINRYVAVHDIGHAINPMSVEGQIEGGVVQGIGQALSEEIVFADGRVLNANLTDYKMPTAMDVPHIESILVESRSDQGPYGVKGIGEPPINCPPAVIANAVARVTGFHPTSLPITAENILLGRMEAEQASQREADI